MTTRQGRGQGLYNGDQLGEVDLPRLILTIESNQRGSRGLLELARLVKLGTIVWELFLDWFAVLQSIYGVLLCQYGNGCWRSFISG